MLTIEIHPNMYKYLTSNQRKINRLLYQIENLTEVIKGDYDTTPLCEVNGICEVVTFSENDTIGNCHYCGAEISQHRNGNWYHWSAYDLNGELEDENYQTHGNYGVKPGDPCTVEARELEEFKIELEELTKIERNVK
jgi:hypothetical protein